jgi:hypothetical protein
VGNRRPAELAVQQWETNEIETFILGITILGGGEVRRLALLFLQVIAIDD